VLCPPVGSEPGRRACSARSFYSPDAESIKRQLSLAARLELPIAIKPLVHPDIIDEHFRREVSRLVRIAQELAPHGHIHDQIERLVERGGPGVEIRLFRRSGSV